MKYVGDGRCLLVDRLVDWLGALLSRCRDDGSTFAVHKECRFVSFSCVVREQKVQVIFGDAQNFAKIRSGLYFVEGAWLSW